MSEAARSVRRGEVPAGIGGLLIPAAVWVALWPILHAGYIVLRMFVPSHSTYVTIVADNPAYISVYWFGVLASAILFFLGLLTVYYFFTRKSDAPRLIIATFVVQAALLGLFLLFALLAGVYFELVLHGLLLGGALAIGALGITYLAMSARVRATFVRPSPKVFAVAARELSSYFCSPTPYIIAAGFLLLSALWFFFKLNDSVRLGGEASLRPLFTGMAYVMVVAIPLLTMGLLSKEFSSGTIETLMTCPVTDTAVIFGKFLGVMVFYLALLASTLLFLLLMLAYGRPDPGVAAMGYLGMVVLGAAYISVGLFASTLTPYQLVSALVGIAILGFFTFGMSRVGDLGLSPWAEMAKTLNAMEYFKNFSRGVLDSRGLIYFLSATALFLFLSVKTLESRRWR